MDDTPAGATHEPLSDHAATNGTVPPLDELAGSVTPAQVAALLAQMDLRIRANQAMLAVLLASTLLVIIQLERLRRHG